MEIQPVLLYGLTATMARLQRSIADLSDDDALRIPIAGLAPIVWQAGHIAVVDATFAHRVDGQTQAPDGYVDLFKAGTGGSASYPPLAEVKNALEHAQRSWETIVRTVDPTTPVDSDRYRNVGELLVFIAYHRGYHVGKINTLRALLQKPRLFG
jgi:uncharacterized damage-inducible protein DinB